MNKFMNLSFENNSVLPLYMQIANAVVNNIQKGNLNIHEKMPSINTFSKKYSVSRDTVEKAYKVLKQRKILVAKKGKGTFVNSSRIIVKTKVLFLINKPSQYKLEVYNAFTKDLGEDYLVNFEVYHCDEVLFFNLLEQNLHTYDYFVIMPHFNTSSDERQNFSETVLKLIKSISSDRLIILDNNDLKLGNQCIEIFQDFERDTFEGLNNAYFKIKKYQELILVTPKRFNYSYIDKITNACKKFCNYHEFGFKVLNEVSHNTIVGKENLFIVLEDDDLVKLLDKLNQLKLELGRDVGVIAFNETPFKRLLGISVMSTNFKLMGETAASMMLNRQKSKVKNKFCFIDRISC
ncbi:GntR family transcriptional regulator [Aestuariibaculum sp. M13]|uniref:GntR family transcriptional regulator n=1 Tax=Aestuariibaculum sp. M13 TaxID=2967132 RepID=UPI002159FAE2|nr:GntR family transcriptional regulator [Aestuariibaculum sp. M13]MCR8668972.1 GntR family transcriptional regulator [Aestuariibaculum sp. M13]